MAESEPHILVVDDHRDIRELVAKYLSRHGLRVSTADCGVAMKRFLKTSAVDLVVLDIMMPGEDGLSLCRNLRETTGLPVILLTCMAEETDRVVGLEIGADDYLTKPFSPREPLARIKAVLRRAQSLPQQRTEVESGRVRFAGWTFDPERREMVDQDDTAVPLSTAEFQLISAFLRHPRIVLSREQLLDLTQGRATKVFDRSIDNQVSRLRRKIEADPKNPTIIQTVWGGGYLFTPKVERL